MPRRVYKYPLVFNDNGRSHVDMPAGAEFLSLQMQHNIPVLWALVDPDQEVMKRHLFLFVGTGDDIPSPSDLIGTLTHRGTLQMSGGHLIIHAFEYAAVGSEGKLTEAQ